MSLKVYYAQKVVGPEIKNVKIYYIFVKNTITVQRICVFNKVRSIETNPKKSKYACGKMILDYFGGSHYIYESLKLDLKF